MRLPTLTGLSLSLLLLAGCGEAGNEAGNLAAADANEIAPAPSDGGPANEATAPGEAAPPQRPENGSEAPEPSGDVTLAAAPASTTQGSTITLTLRNGSREPVGYNLCTSALETSAGRPVPTGRECTMELRTLEPGRGADYRYELPANMVEGSYRFQTQVEWMNSGRRAGIRSNSFEVR